MKLKKLILLSMMGVFTLVLMACSDNNSISEAEANDFISEYGIGEEHRFHYITMEEALQLRNDESFNGILYFGFPGCPWCQAVMPLLHQVAQETEVDVFYVSRRHDLREGEWLDWDLEMAWWLYNNNVPNMRWLDEDGGLVDVGEEEGAYRPNINVPQIIHLRNGVVVDSHRGTFEGHDPVGEGEARHLPELTSTETATLLDIYIRIFSGVNALEACEIINETCS